MERELSDGSFVRGSAIADSRAIITLTTRCERRPVLERFAQEGLRQAGTRSELRPANAYLAKPLLRSLPARAHSFSEMTTYESFHESHLISQLRISFKIERKIGGQNAHVREESHSNVGVHRTTNLVTIV
jgi:hypothetical protein